MEDEHVKLLHEPLLIIWRDSSLGWVKALSTQINCNLVISNTPNMGNIVILYSLHFQVWTTVAPSRRGDVTTLGDAFAQVVGAYC